MEEGMLEASSTDPWIPHTTAVSPRRTTALPCVWVRLDVWMWGVREVRWVRDEGRRGEVEEERCAVR